MRFFPKEIMAVKVMEYKFFHKQTIVYKCIKIYMFPQMFLRMIPIKMFIMVYPICYLSIWLTALKIAIHLSSQKTVVN